MRSVTAKIIAAAAIICLPSSALAQVWEENFDSYAAGTVLDNVGGWAGWDNTPAAAGVVTDAQARSGPNSVDIGAAADAVHPFTGNDSGQWTLTAWHFMPVRPLQNETFFIVNNVYNHGGPYEWTVQVGFNPVTGMVTDAFRPDTPIAIAWNRWAEIRLEIDLDADTIDTFYDGSLLSSGQYTIRGGPAEIANIDLFGNGTQSFYDDISLVPEPGTALLVIVGSGFALIRRRRA
jgi:hypothetical protein